MLYYSERKKVVNGKAETPVYHSGERDAMERKVYRKPEGNSNV